MKWTGKVVGAVLGAATGLGPIGVLVGLVIGHAYDESTRRDEADEGAPPQDAARVRDTFFRTVFSVMGHVAKSDGRVSEQEIAAAREVFRQLRLSESATREAIQWFTRGKEPGFALDASLAALRQDCAGRHDILRMFLEIQLRAALLGSGLQGPARSVLVRIAQQLGISGLEFAHMEAVLRLQGYGAAHAHAGAGYAGGQAGGPSTAPRRDTLREAYEILEVAPVASDAEVTKAYRRQMSQNHPDKLVARGLPESMLEIAKEKTQAIQAAYERIREARGMR